MRKVVLWLCVCLMASVAYSQTVYEKHDVSATYGAVSIPFVIYGHRGPDPVSFSAQYLYNQTNKLGFGCLISYSPVRDSGWDEERVTYYGDVPHYEYISHGAKTVGAYLSLMPAIRYSWVSKRGFRFYSKATLGISYDTDEKKTDWALQFSPIGLAFGRSVYGVFELGLGRQGLLVLGIGGRF